MYLLALAPLAIAFTFRRGFNQLQLSPTLLTTAVLSACALAGYALQGVLAAGGGAGTSIILSLTPETANKTVVLIAVAAIATVISSASCQHLFGRRQFMSDGMARRPSTIIRFWLFLTATVAPLVVIIGNGVGNYWDRSFYFISSKGSLVGSLGTPLVMASLLLAGYLFATAAPGQRALAIFVALIGVSVLFSGSSRSFALSPLLFAIGYAVSGRMKRWWSLVIVAAVSGSLLPLPLFFRGQPQQGLLPNFEALLQLRASEIDWQASLSNLLVTFPIVGTSAYGAQQIPFKDLWVSLNPLPGGLVGWDQLSAQLRLNTNTPMAGLGELGNYGFPTVIVFFALLGILLSWFERSIASSIERQGYIFPAVLLGLITLFAVQLIEYNLRSGVRLLLYAAALEAGRRILTLPRRADKRAPKFTSTRVPATASLYAKVP
jgi:hypothetical protein